MEYPSSETDSDTYMEESEYSSNSYTEDEPEVENEDGDGIDYADEIADYEDSFQSVDCVHNKYYIGTYKYVQSIVQSNNSILFAKKINLSTFYKYSKRQISEYLYWFSGIYISSKPPLEIVQVKISSNGFYSCIIKTFWLRIIQRRWKAVFHKERKFYKANILSILDCRQRTCGPTFMPKLPGLLSIYQK